VNPVIAVSGVLVLLGLAVFGVLAWAVRKVTLLERPVDVGDLAVLGVLAIFGSFCLALGWLLLRHRSDAQGAAQADAVTDAGGEPARRRVTLSQGCATAGVLLLMLSVLLPERWYPVALLFVGLALLALSHVLTPCEERIAKLRRARASLRQL